MPLSAALARWLAGEGHDAVHASDLKLQCAADAEIMSRAAQEGRTVITADLDYPRLLALGQAIEPSLILFRHGDWSEAETIARLSDILCALSEADITQSILVVDRNRVRRRRLPIT
jgi:predicted nuclease of predicted toxin-antitoxin system